MVFLKKIMEWKLHYYNRHSVDIACRHTLWVNTYVPLRTLIWILSSSVYSSSSFPSSSSHSSDSSIVLFFFFFFFLFLLFFYSFLLLLLPLCCVHWSNVRYRIKMQFIKKEIDSEKSYVHVCVTENCVSFVQNYCCIRSFSFLFANPCLANSIMTSQISLLVGCKLVMSAIPLPLPRISRSSFANYISRQNGTFAEMIIY